MDGPVVLAGLNPMPGYNVAHADDITDARVQPNHLIRGIPLVGDPEQPETILIPDNEREWWFWQGSYRTPGQPQDIRFIPFTKSAMKFSQFISLFRKEMDNHEKNKGHLSQRL